MKFRSGKYSYRGYVITNHGYYHPDHHVWWEAVKDNNADYHGRTFREVMRMIDDGFRDEETKELKERISLLERALKPVMECDMSVRGYGVRIENAVREAQRIMKEGEEK